ncbi:MULTISPECIES: lysine N(6)-hydroxylase/L-ornithine N(5)-oxygenase family protein [Thermomonospora]|uniref:L-lysine N6-monooxygenase MbtG n=1 Tax=Thermomonospora curvata (strain ATCC 19995 / DSM 43183 / JCM 3096 / KCTC 9072 / NBRC 15933 / NCIMB 10081 / Henssen B9) TaxID=471852 RepID=D1A5R1_THECD|nr:MULTISPECIES: lysine N(6)-hydroxylase/L-ornithine N(5)-oxygenase family protein [Thermomonospora]ACY98206.1 L-lysine 6-monooxygenase (NADPH) [Thermomonospora curvata DSM 43183]PKK13973.1 MAG: L-lysine 6-monooxygenase [Thermomonospora sp. CIF 1]
MPLPPTCDSADHVHDVVGIGFGPSNLALAIALREHNATAAEGDRIEAVFFERQPAFGWHRGMLIDGATMQVSFLKDLVTMRNPTSEFSFLNYLRERGRLADFINHKTLFPSRAEFHDYLEWAAGHFDGQVEYGAEVVTVRPVPEQGPATALDVVVRRGGSADELVTHRTRNLVIAIGLEPVLPPEAPAGERVWHSHELLHRTPALHDPKRLLVVGAGQSAAEVTEYLHRTFPAAEICAVFARYGYTPADDSSFANRIFDPEAVDHFYAAPEDVKRMLLDYHHSTNYSAVDMDLIDELYRRLYQEKVTGRRRLRLFNVSRIADVEATGSAVRACVEFLPTGERTELEADALIYATGYRVGDPSALLGEVGEHCLRRPDGTLRVERDYRIATTDALRCGIYVQGATEHTHGIASTLLSVTAIRVGEIVQSLTAARSAAPNPPYALSR